MMKVSLLTIFLLTDVFSQELEFDSTILSQCYQDGLMAGKNHPRVREIFIAGGAFSLVSIIFENPVLGILASPIATIVMFSEEIYPKNENNSLDVECRNEFNIGYKETISKRRIQNIIIGSAIGFGFFIITIVGDIGENISNEVPYNP